MSRSVHGSPDNPEFPAADDAASSEPEQAAAGQIARHTTYGVAADVATAVSGLVLAVIVARFLGAEGRGVYFLSVLTTHLIAIAGDIGFSTTGLVYAASRESRVTALNGIALSLSLVAGAAGTAALLLLATPLTHTILGGLDHTLLLLVGLAIVPTVYSQIAAGILTGMGRIPGLSLTRIANAVAAPLVTALALWATDGDITAGVLAAAIVATALAVPMGVEIVRGSGLPTLPPVAESRALLAFGARAWIGTIAHHGFLRVDTLFLSAHAGPKPVGQYSLASILAERISLVGQAVYGAGAARIGSAAPHDAALLVARMIRVLLLMLIPAGAVMAILAKPVMTLIFGPDFGAAALPFALLLPGTICLTLWSVVGLFLIAVLHKPTTTSLIQGIGLLVSLPAYYFAVKAGEMTGAAIVSSVVYSAVLAGGVKVMLDGTDLRLRDLVPRPTDVRDIRDLVQDRLSRRTAG